MGSTGGTLPQYPWEVYDSTAGQTVAAITDAGSRAGLLAVVNGTAAGSGGGIVFGSAATHVAGVLASQLSKAFLTPAPTIVSVILSSLLVTRLQI